MKSQFNSSEGPIKMVENATVLRPDSRKKNVSNFPVQLFPVDSWQKFEDAYIKGQTNDHLHYIFEQMGVAKRLGKGVFRLKLSIHLMPCCDTKTEKLHLFILNRCLLVLVRDLDVKTVCMHIQQREVLDDVTVRDISEQQTTSDKTRELIKQIQERDQDTYEKFKECLVQAEQAFLKDMLEEEEAKYAKKIEGELILLMKDILNGIWDTYLKQLDLRPLAEKIGEKVLDNASRKENLECLLKRLFGSKGINAGYIS